MASAPDTVTAATEQLRAEGYDLEADVRHGRVEFRVDGEWVVPDSVEVERIHRFEGASDPSDEMIVLGVHDPAGGRRGVMVAAYGVDIDGETADCLRSLVDDR